MHLQFRCNFPRDQRLIVKSGYRVLKWPPTCNELWRRMIVGGESCSMVSRLWPPAVNRLMLMGSRVDIQTIVQIGLTISNDYAEGR